MTMNADLQHENRELQSMNHVHGVELAKVQQHLREKVNIVNCFSETKVILIPNCRISYCDLVRGKR